MAQGAEGLPLRTCGLGRLPAPSSKLLLVCGSKLGSEFSKEDVVQPWK